MAEYLFNQIQNDFNNGNNDNNSEKTQTDLSAGVNITYMLFELPGHDGHIRMKCI